MMSKADFFLKKTLGEDFLESLTKFELWKPGTKSVLDHEEIRTALQIVPRTVIALLIRELSPMEIGETKEVDLFSDGNALMTITKHERDVYSGQIDEANRKISEFKFRSLPGVGLVIMSAFELYDMENLINTQTPTSAQTAETVEPTTTRENPLEDLQSQVQSMIDERLMLHDLIGKVVDKKIMEKEAIQKMVLVKLTEAMSMVDRKVGIIEAHIKTIETRTTIENSLKEKKKRPLQTFLEKKKKPNEFSIELTKGEVVSCPDCGKNIFNEKAFSGCICFGDHGKVFLKKTEGGVKVRFGRGWDQENIEMLLEVLQKKNK
jgi:hypothetical protein